MIYFTIRSKGWHYRSASLFGTAVEGTPCGRDAWRGDFANGGRESGAEGLPGARSDARLQGPGLRKAIPYGVYDFWGEQGLVSVSLDHDTAAFSTSTLPGWWERAGARRTRTPMRMPDHRRRERSEQSDWPGTTAAATFAETKEVVATKKYQITLLT